MAGEGLEVGFQVTGFEKTASALRQVGELAQQATGKMAGATQQAAESAGRFSKGVAAAKQVVGDFSSALAGAAAIASIFARGNEELKRTLEVTSLALSGLGTAVRSVFAVVRGLIALLGGWVTAIAAVTVAVVLLVRNWDQVLAIGRRLWQSFAAFLSRLWGSIVEMAKGLGQIIAGVFTIDPARIQQGIAQFKTGVGQLRTIAVDVGTQIVDKLKLGWDALTRLFGQSGKAAEDAAAKRFQLLMQTLDFERTVGTLSLEQEQKILETKGRQFAAAINDRGARLQALVQVEQRLQQISTQILQRWLDDNAATIAALKDQGKAWEGLASEAGRAAGRMGRSTEATAKAAQGVIDQATQDALAANLRRLIADHDAYTHAIEEATAAQEEWDRQLEFDRRITADLETGIERQIVAHRRRLELMDEGIEKLRAEREGLQQLIATIQAEIAALQAEIAAKIAAALPTEELIRRLERLRDIQAELGQQSALVGKEIQQNMLEPLRQLAEAVRSAFEGLFTDILSGAKSFGESLLDFFRNVVNSIIRIIAQNLALIIVRFLGLPLARGGIVQGGLTPLVAAQAGTVVSQPTLALIGEGQRSEAVVPLPDNRSIPVKFTGQREAKPQEIVVKTYVLLDRSQLPRTDPDEITQIVLADIRSRGPIYSTIRQAVGRR